MEWKTGSFTSGLFPPLQSPCRGGRNVITPGRTVRIQGHVCKGRDRGVKETTDYRKAVDTKLVSRPRIHVGGYTEGERRVRCQRRGRTRRRKGAAGGWRRLFALRMEVLGVEGGRSPGLGGVVLTKSTRANSIHQRPSSQQAVVIWEAGPRHLRCPYIIMGHVFVPRN